MKKDNRTIADYKYANKVLIQTTYGFILLALVLGFVIGFVFGVAIW